MNTPEERNEIERMENEGGKSAWWNDTTRNEPYTNPAASNQKSILNREPFDAFIREVAGEKLREARDNLSKTQQRVADRIADREERRQEKLVQGVAASRFKPYYAYSYAGHGWVEVRSKAQGFPKRRLCLLCDGSETLIPDALLQGDKPSGD